MKFTQYIVDCIEIIHKMDIVSVCVHVCMWVRMSDQAGDRAHLLNIHVTNVLEF